MSQAETMDVRELLARSLFSDRFRLRLWDTAKLWQKQTSYQKADEALRRAGIDGTLKLRTKIVQKENVR